jgi:alkanesulfonate monooxygenase SsuD/methylene tetrahydromethanopterin reductase-like flavin-dependent oxidoreductase (luciferase family)
MTELSSTERPRFRLGFLTHVQGRGNDFAATYRNAQELFVVADELGFDVGWVAQHHAPLGGGGLSSPWTFLAHAAARTTRIRLATAITILPLLSRALANREVGTEGFTIQPPAADFSHRIWQGVFSGPGAQYAAAAGSNLLVNRAAYGYDEPTDEVQRPWADAYLAAWQQPRRPRIGLSRFVFPAKDRRTALDQIGSDVLAAAQRFGPRLGFPEGMDADEALRRFHSFYGHPDEIVLALQQEKVLPVATDLIAQFNPAVPDHDSAVRALELIATEVAPALGWKPAAFSEAALAGSEHG